jgi:GntR family transcriptional regulator
LKISLKGKGNVFEQIVDEYIRLISLGVILEGEKLPSCRNLAKELGINPNTVEKAYQMLEEKGYIHVIPKKGVYVLDKKTNLLNDNIKKYINTIKDKISYDELLILINEVYKEGDLND